MNLVAVGHVSVSDEPCWSLPDHRALVCRVNLLENSLHFDDMADHRDLKESVTFFKGSPVTDWRCMSDEPMFLAGVDDCKNHQESARVIKAIAAQQDLSNNNCADATSG